MSIKQPEIEDIARLIYENPSFNHRVDSRKLARAWYDKLGVEINFKSDGEEFDRMSKYIGRFPILELKEQGILFIKSDSRNKKIYGTNRDKLKEYLENGSTPSPIPPQ